MHGSTSWGNPTPAAASRETGSDRPRISTCETRECLVDTSQQRRKLKILSRAEWSEWQVVRMADEVVFIGGPSGVGKSSVGLEMHAQLSAAEVSHCVIDGDFLDMAHPTPWEHRLAERNLAAMWTNYRALGYTRLIYTNTVSVLPTVMQSLLQAMGGDLEAVAILLTCNEDTARQRLGEREKGSALNHHIELSRKMAVTLEADCPPTVHRVPTDTRSIQSVAAHVIRLTAWLTG